MRLWLKDCALQNELYRIVDINIIAISHYSPLRICNDDEICNTEIQSHAIIFMHLNWSMVLISFRMNVYGCAITLKTVNIFVQLLYGTTIIYCTGVK